MSEQKQEQSKFESWAVLAPVKSVIAPLPPEDGRDWECQCARCGSSVGTEACDTCDGGLVEHDCGEDSCDCVDPEEPDACDICEGRGFFRACLSSPEWCEANPAPGRQYVPMGSLEWFVVERGGAA